MTCNLCKLRVALSLHKLHVRPLLRRCGVTCDLCKLNVPRGHRRDTEWTPTGHRQYNDGDRRDTDRERRKEFQSSRQCPPSPPPIIDQVATPISIDQMIKHTALTTWSSLGLRPENQFLKTLHTIKAWKTHGNTARMEEGLLRCRALLVPTVRSGQSLAPKGTKWPWHWETGVGTDGVFA